VLYTGLPSALIPSCPHSGDAPIPHGLRRPTQGLQGAPSVVRTKRYVPHDGLTRIRFLLPPGATARTVHHPNRDDSLTASLGATYFADMNCAFLSHFWLHTVTSV